MNAPRTRSSRTGRIAAATAGLGLVALAVAPAALAGYDDVAPAPTTAVLGAAQATDVHATKHPAKHAARHTASTSHLAYTGFEAGGVAVAGLGLLAGGVLLVRAGRRGEGSAA